MTIKGTDHEFCLFRKKQQSCFLEIVEAKIKKIVDVDLYSKNFWNVCEG